MPARCSCAAAPSAPTRRSGSASCTASRPIDDLDAAVDAVVADLLAGGPEALAETKLLLDEVSAPAAPGAGPETARRIARVRVRDEAQAGIRAFLERETQPWR